jgi:Na+-translocating ferredoxin:NAD+ oxidoreductase RnfA subunit
MKSKQLANVLIKTIGLYICLLAIPSFISGILLVFMKWDEKLLGTLSYSIGASVQAAVGICLIIMSRKLAGFWFKDEDE